MHLYSAGNSRDNLRAVGPDRWGAAAAAQMSCRLPARAPATADSSTRVKQQTSSQTFTVACTRTGELTEPSREQIWSSAGNSSPKVFKREQVFG